MVRLAISNNQKVLTWPPLGRVALTRLRKHLIAKALFLGGVILLSQGFYMSAKAILAQELIALSWQQRTAVSPPPKPWWWADTNAIAKLEVNRLNQRVYVMKDDSGESLAFGPGHLNASADISSDGHVMIAGHRDSHFEFLQQLVVGDVISTTDYKSATAQYQVTDISVLNTQTDDLVLQEANQLTLITCFPFKGFIPGGPLRYIINAKQLET